MVCGISFVFRGISLPKCCFLYLESRSYSKKSAFFRKKTKSFDSKNEVLAPLTLRFFGKKRRFSTVKTPSFSGRFSICLQDVEIQSFAKPSNTRKISGEFLLTENSRATKLMNLKIVNRYLRKSPQMVKNVKSEIAGRKVENGKGKISLKMAKRGEMKDEKE